MIGYIHVDRYQSQPQQSNQRSSQMANVEVNKEAPDFELDDYQGNRFKLSDFKGKSNVLVVLNRGLV